MKKQNGYIDGEVVWAIFGLLFILAVIGIIVAVIFTKIELGNQRVSGIAYNVKNDTFPVGNTKFSIRASENTYVSEENKSSYCLPSNSQYTNLVNEAAENKEIKLVIKTQKGFWWRMPWSCIDNVTVEKLTEEK